MQKNAKIGIINRGEAAVRFVRAAKEFNTLYGTAFETIAFYTSAESDALFIKEADQAFNLEDFVGFGTLTGSPYLACEFLIDALRQTACEGIWVGWGFVAENAAFAALAEKHGLVLIGPSAEAMDLLGDKIKAKDLADRSQVPTCPWSGSSLETLEEARAAAERIGYPVILKSANGGGGRGIRKVLTPDELPQQFKSVTDEIFRFYGNRVIFLEALVVRGRHLEVQALGDLYGNVHTFGVRDCSVQRNNQKIIEETPPALLPREVMSEVEAAAARLLKAAAYHGAGTVEYLYDMDRGQAYFMEVNTRLQVEHPITEELFQVDLVHLQLRVALGEELKSVARSERGHVIEVRLNAEDPDQKFAPTPGLIKRFLLPQLPGIRIDTGFEEGGRVPREYDSMIAKIIAQGSNRPATIARLTRALRELKVEIENGTTNQGFLLELLEAEEIKHGGVQTNFVENFLLRQQRRGVKTRWDIALLAAVVYRYEQKYQDELENFTEKVSRFSAPRVMPSLVSDMQLSLHGHKYNLQIRAVGDEMYHITIDQGTIAFEYSKWGNELILKAGGEKFKAQIVPRANALQCEVEGVPYMLPLDASGMITAPSPSVVLTVEVKEGQKVKKGDLLLTLEAMKMEMTVSAPEDGTVTEVMVKAGEQVAAGQSLVDMEAEKSESVAEESAPGETFDRIDFSRLIIPALPQSSQDLDKSWKKLVREYRAVFLGYDVVPPVSRILQQVEAFTQAHPAYRAACAELYVKAVQAFIKVQRLFQDDISDTEGSRGADVYECLMHFTLRREDREKGLPASFLQRLDQAVSIYGWADQKDYEAKTRALFHLFKAYAATRDSVELIRSSLLSLQQMYSKARDFLAPQQFSDLMDELVRVGREHFLLTDAAIYTRYELVDRVFQEEIQNERKTQVAALLKSVLEKNEEDPRLMQDVLDSGHQIISHLVSQYERTSNRARTILELVGRRFNRDRTFVKAQHRESEGQRLYVLQCKSHAEEITSVTTILEEHDFLSGNFAWLKAALEGLQRENLECIILLRTRSEQPEAIYAHHLAKFPLPVSLCSIGLVRDDDYSYRSFAYENGEWCEEVRRRAFSPLRYRELRLDRLINFDIELLYHSRYVHVIKLEAKDNSKDQRLFGFVEVPETKFDLSESQLIERIDAFELGMLEVLKAIREQQARHRRAYYWNRIVVHIGHTHPLKLEQIGQYPHKILGLVEGIGLEKIVIYTKIAGRQRKAIESEVLVENFATQYSVRGRIPSRHPLMALDAYTTKVVNSMRLQSPYPYEVVRMLTNSSSQEFQWGQFIEYDIQFDASGQQQTISVEGRVHGNNNSNVVFGRIRNRDQFGHVFERVLLLGDPSKDLGSLAEAECRRVIAAIDMAEAEDLPLEWIPVSSGAAIDMQTGTENLDWTARALRRVVEFTQNGGEINIIVAGINVGAQSYWNAEATMLMHTRGLLIMTEKGTMVLTGKKALDFSGSVSAEDNIGIGGVERIMGPNGQAQFRVKDLAEAYRLLFRHYRLTAVSMTIPYGTKRPTQDPVDRDVGKHSYQDRLNQGFQTIGDIIGAGNAERKKPFDMRQVMHAVRDQDGEMLERWQNMRDAENAIVWETQICGFPVGMIGIESRPLKRYGDIPNDGPDSWTGGTLFPHSSKKVARAINAFSAQVPVVVLANLSGFDGSPESLRKLQLEYGAEIGRAVVNFKGPLLFIVIARYHGGAYVVFSKALNPSMRVAALEATYASVIGGAPAAAVVFPRQVLKNTFADPQVVSLQEKLKRGEITQAQFDDIFQTAHLEQQAKLAQKFEKIHSVERALKVGSIDDIVAAPRLRSYIAQQLEAGIKNYMGS